MFVNAFTLKNSKICIDLNQKGMSTLDSDGFINQFSILFGFYSH